MKYFNLFTTATLLIIFSSPFVRAEQTNLKVRILPIDCLFEVIDVGTQQLRYLTPETCPIDEIPTPPEEVPTSPGGTNPITIKRSNYISDYYQENINQPVTQSNNQPKVASAKEHKDIFDLINSSKDTEILLVTLLVAFLALVIVRRMHKRSKDLK